MNIPGKTHYTFTPGKDDATRRLDQFLAHKTGDLSRSEIRKRIDLGGVHVDGKRVRKCSAPIRPGKRIELYLDRGSLQPFRLDDDHILYQDNWLLVVNKPAGVESQPTRARYKGCLYEAVAEYLSRRPGHSKPSIGMVQRLDRDTSGCVLFSIHPHCHKRLTRMMKAREVKRLYLALITGTPNPSDGELQGALTRIGSNRSRPAATPGPGARLATTLYRTIEKFESCSAIEAKLLTGRTHQIRVQFNQAGHPLLGDRKYGGPERYKGEKIPRQLLHAKRIMFRHPITKTRLEIEAPLPPDIAYFLGFARGKT